MIPLPKVAEQLPKMEMPAEEVREVQANESSVTEEELEK